MDKINDKVLGEIEYDFGWIKIEEIPFFDSKYNVKMVFEAFEDEDITDTQRNNYIEFTKNIDEISKKAINKLSDYLVENFTGMYVVKNIIVPTSVFFKQDGHYGVLCEFDLDEENGLAIVVSNDYDVISQDMFL